MVRGKFEHGLIFDPVRDEMFMASQGAGAFVRYMSTSQRLRVSRVKSVRGSLIGVSGGYTPEVQSSMLDIQTQLVSKKSVVRKSGSAALDIAYVACGRLDGYISTNLSLWDYAAGVVIVREAGGLSPILLGQVILSKIKVWWQQHQA